MDYLTMAIRKIEGDCNSHAARVNAAKTLAEVVRAAEVIVKPELRAIRHSIPGLRRLDSQAQNRIAELTRARIQAIREAATVQGARSLRGKLMVECNVLRGKFPMQYNVADRESQRAVFEKERALVSKPEDPS